MGVATASNQPRAYTWPGIVGHLSGLENHSGQNGLSTFRFGGGGSAWWERIPFSDRLSIISVEGVQRSYGDIVYPPSSAVALQAYRFQTPVGVFMVKVAVDAAIPPMAVGASAILSISLLSLLDLLRDLLNRRVPVAARHVVPLLDQIRTRLPDISLYGAVGIGGGISSRGDGYIRLTTAGGVAVTMGGGQGSTHRSGQPNRNGVGGYGAVGRGWQITLRNWRGHIPGA